MPKYKNIAASLLGLVETKAKYDADGKVIGEPVYERRLIKPREEFECPAEVAAHHLSRGRVKEIATAAPAKASK